jgi:hypothetical protein
VAPGWESTGLIAGGRDGRLAPFDGTGTFEPINFATIHGGETMAVKLNKRAFDHAKSLICTGKYVADDRDAWSEHQPSAQQESDFIREHGYAEYARWHLGIDDAYDEEVKGRYKFPDGDFERIHRCGLLAAESRAGQRKYYDIELAVAHLHGMLDALRKTT